MHTIDVVIDINRVGSNYKLHNLVRGNWMMIVPPAGNWLVSDIEKTMLAVL
jgi:hypothetical protein